MGITGRCHCLVIFITLRLCSLLDTYVVQRSMLKFNVVSVLFVLCFALCLLISFQLLAGKITVLCCMRPPYWEAALNIATHHCLSHCTCNSGIVTLLCMFSMTRVTPKAVSVT